MEISDVWGEAKEQIGSTIDSNTTDIATVNGRMDVVKEKMFDQDLMYKVGDILMSVGSAPSDKWLKCNGTKVTKAQVTSELLNLLKQAPYGFTRYSYAYPALVISNGVYGVMTSGSTLSYTSDPTSLSWDTQSLPGGIESLYYLGGKWIGLSSGSQIKGTLYYTSKPGNTWSTATWGGDGSFDAREIGYSGSTYLIAARMYSYPNGIDIYTASSINGTWTHQCEVMPTTTCRMMPTGVYGCGSTWFFRAYDTYPSTDVYYTYMSTDGGKTFSQFTNSTINSNMPTACDGTTWAITYSSAIYKSTKPTGTWTKVTIDGFTPQTTIKYENGLWQVRGYDSAKGSYVILTSKSLTGTWNRTYVDNFPSDYYYVDDDNYIYYDGNNYIYTPHVKALPNITSTSGQSYYVKAK